MPKISNFKNSPNKFKRARYTPWDDSPTPPPASYPSTPKLKETETSSYKENSKEVQKGFNKDSKEVQKGFNKDSKEVQKGFRKDPKGVQEKTEHKQPDFQGTNFYDLVGSQKDILGLLSTMCYSNNSFITPPIRVVDLSKTLGISKQTTKTAIRRLKEKGLVVKSKSKRGVGGYAQFTIEKHTRNRVLEIQQDEIKNKKKSAFEIGSEMGSKIGSSPPVVSSSNIINTTTSMSTQNEAIDIEPLSSFGFGQSHLVQIRRAYEHRPEVALSDEIIQDSIHAMAFDLKHNQAAKAFKKPPAVILVSLLKRGQPYSSQTPDKYLSPRDEAMKAYLDAKALQHKHQFEREQALHALEYETWLSALPEDELLAFAREEDFVDIPVRLKRTLRRREALKLSRDYFDAEIWPERKRWVLATLQEGELIDLKKNKSPSPSD